MRNAWDDKFFSMLMLDNEQNNGAMLNAGMMNGGGGLGLDAMGLLGQHTGQGLTSSAMLSQQPVISDRPLDIASNNQHMHRRDDVDEDDNDLSSVSTSDMP
jgi:hypothetical protein